MTRRPGRGRPLDGLRCGLSLESRNDNGVYGPAIQGGERQTGTNRALAGAGRGCPADRVYLPPAKWGGGKYTRS